MQYTHRTGARPLPGFTIKRGVGQGGFGEVYFAISDAGKESALKLLRGSTNESELRGIAACLNLKHPNLVHIYDLLKDERGAYWLVMEYVRGDSMAQKIEAHPQGIKVDLVLEWFRGLAKAVSYLHDAGIVHRDLKPANVFIEHGALKVGDYGLCKTIGSNDDPLTQTVGTLEYMAPEVASGKYTKSVDIYACGVILYELLVGRRPFSGQTAAEVQMQHLITEPNLRPLPAPFRTVVARALAKDPARRYATMQDMLQAVEAAAGDTAPVELVKATPLKLPEPIKRSWKMPSMGFSGAIVRDRLTDLTGAMLHVPVVAAIGVIGWAAVAGHLDEWVPLGKGLLLTVAIAWAVLLGVGGSKAATKATWSNRFRMAGFGLLIGVLAFWLDGWPGPELARDDGESSHTEPYLFNTVRMTPSAVPVLGHYLMYFTAALGLIGWWKFTGKDRKEHFSIFPVITTSLWAVILSFLWPQQETHKMQFGYVPLALAAVAVQWVSPWLPPPPPMPRRLRWRA